MRGPANVALGVAGRRLLNTRLKGIGEITDLAIDTGAQTVDAHVSLAGEKEPIAVHIYKYEVDRSGDDATFTVVDASTSREWLDAALRRFVLGQRIIVPTRAAVLLKLLS